MPKIEMKYIFLKKDNKNQNNDFRFDTFENILKRLFSNVNSEYFDVENKGYVYKIYYEEKKEFDKDIYYLNLYVESTKVKGSAVLDLVNRRLIRGKHRGDYN